jgi:hypothetical protein
MILDHCVVHVEGCYTDFVKFAELTIVLNRSCFNRFQKVFIFSTVKKYLSPCFILFMNFTPLSAMAGVCLCRVSPMKYLGLTVWRRGGGLAVKSYGGNRPYVHASFKKKIFYCIREPLGIPHIAPSAGAKNNDTSVCFLFRAIFSCPETSTMLRFFQGG